MNQALKEDGNEEMPLLSLASLSDLAGSSSLDDEFKVWPLPRSFFL